MKIRSFFIVLIFLVSANSLLSQQYDSAIGARLGVPLSVSYKKMISETNALEGYIGTKGAGDYRFVNISGAYQKVQPLDFGNIEELYYYYGGGASIYFWSFAEDGPNQSATPGVQGYLGVEYTFADRPVHLSLDWIPSIIISGHLSGFRGGYFTVGIRYVLDRRAVE